MIYTGGTLEELLSILKEIVHFQVGSINLSTSIGVAHSNECTTVERLKMLADERLYKSKKTAGRRLAGSNHYSQAGQMILPGLN